MPNSGCGYIRMTIFYMGTMNCGFFNRIVLINLERKREKKRNLRSVVKGNGLITINSEQRGYKMGTILIKISCCRSGSNKIFNLCSY